jgi:hypothetical protein
MNPQVAEDASGHIYLVWNATPATSSGPQNPAFPNGVFSLSDDGGATFTTPVTIFSSGGFPHIGLDPAGDIFVSWIGASSSVSANAVFVSRSTDGGKTFTTSAPISDPSKKAIAPHMVTTSSGEIDVIWQYNNNGQSCDSSDKFQSSCAPCDIWFAQSADGAKSFSAPINVSHSSGCAGLDSRYEDEQQIQVDSSGNVNLVWDDSVAGVMFSRSSDGGKTFSLPAIISPPQGVYPKVAVDATGGIDLIWAPADGSGGLLFRRSSDGGITFSQPKSMGTGYSSPFADNPQLATDASGDIDVLWLETHRIQFSQSSDGGASFSSPISISTDTTNFSDVSPDIDPFFTKVHMAVESHGDVDLTLASDQFGGNTHSFLWFSRGVTSSTPPPTPLFVSLNYCCSSGILGKAYNGDVTTSGGAPPYSINANGLPPGLSLSASSGSAVMIQGIPTQAGTFAAVFTAQDAAGVKASSSLNITISPSSGSGSSVTRSSR